MVVIGVFLIEIFVVGRCRLGDQVRFVCRSMPFTFLEEPGGMWNATKILFSKTKKAGDSHSPYI